MYSYTVYGFALTPEISDGGPAVVRERAAVPYNLYTELDTAVLVAMSTMQRIFEMEKEMEQRTRR
jgi:hypothetical protein